MSSTRFRPVTSAAESLSALAEPFAAIERRARECAVEDLPELAGQIVGWAARIDREISLRIATAARPATAAPLRPLLTVPEVSKLLRISPGEVYRRSKEDLKPATVTLGPGGLRFDPNELEELIRARTG
jgi:predicted DNA-binding transcriptional regulator AlpA